MVSARLLIIASILMFVFYFIGIIIGVDIDNDAVADVSSPDSRRTLQALQDTAKAQTRQAKALEEISRKIGVRECECKN